jgi:hypothetical protein
MPHSCVEHSLGGINVTRAGFWGEKLVRLQTFVDRLGLCVLVEGEGLDSEVRWVHASELADPARYLTGGELLLVAGTNLSIDDCEDYVARLKVGGVVALGFGATPIFDSPPAWLVRACAAQGLALVGVPPDVPFVSISHLFYEELVATETRSLRQMSDSHRRIIKAATGPDPILAVIHEVAASLDAWVVLIDRNLNRQWESSDLPVPHEVVQALMTVSASNRPTSVALASPDNHVEVQWVAGPARTGYAIAVGKPVGFTAMDRAIVDTATSALPLLFSDPQRWPIGDLGSCAVRIALEPDRAGPSLSRLLGDPSDGAWRVIVGECGKFGAHSTDDRLRGLADLLETPLVDVQGDAFVAIVTADADADADADELRKRLDKAKTICGVSSAMPWWQIAAAHAEARQMRGTAQRRLCTVVAGPAKGRLAAMLTTDKTRTFSRAILAPITADQRRANELLKTLRSWLANHGSWDRTATALGVHRNTVRHRLAQVEHLIERDLSDPDVRMELWFALQWTNTVT